MCVYIVYKHIATYCVLGLFFQTGLRIFGFHVTIVICELSVLVIGSYVYLICPTTIIVPVEVAK